MREEEGGGEGGGWGGGGGEEKEEGAGRRWGEGRGGGRGHGGGDLSTKRALFRDLQIQVLTPKTEFLKFSSVSV